MSRVRACSVNGPADRRMSSGHAVDHGTHNATAKKRERNGATITYTKSEIDEDNNACGQAIVMSKQSRCKTDCAALSGHHHGSAPFHGGRSLTRVSASTKHRVAVMQFAQQARSGARGAQMTDAVPACFYSAFRAGILRRASQSPLEAGLLEGHPSVAVKAEARGRATRKAEQRRRGLEKRTTLAQSG